MTLHVVCWKWRGRGGQTRYAAHHVNMLAAMLDRHLRDPHRLLCVTDDPLGIEHETFPLWRDLDDLGNPNGPSYPSCYRRLKLFSADQQSAMGIARGDRVLSIDLDVVIVADVTDIFRRADAFVAWPAVGKHHPLVYNGTLFMFRAGSNEHLWTDFDQRRSPRVVQAARYFGSDQAWLSYKLAGKVAEWGAESGIYAYMHDMVFDPALPKDARIVSFHGRRKPWDADVQAEAPWVARHWRA